MTDDDDVSRRIFVKQLAFVGGAVVVGGCKDKTPPEAPAKPPQALTTKHATFTNDEFAIVSAAAERVLPKDEDPGAIELGVPEYIDRILQTPQLAQMKQNFVPGVAALNRRCERMFKVGFVAATAKQQDEVITAFKDSPEKSGEARWYEMLVVLTMEGAFSDPSYGGNKGGAGWKLLGFTLVGSNVKGDPGKGYDGMKALNELRCGGRGC